MAWPDSFLTERLRAERLRTDHFPELRRMHTDARVMEHLGGVFTEAQSQAYLERNLAHWHSHNHGLWILYEREGDAAPIGRGLLRYLTVDGADHLETGYAFYEPFWGRGLATEITRSATALGFERLHASSIVAVTTEGNGGSQHVLTKCGFAYDRDIDRGGELLKLFRLLR